MSFSEYEAIYREMKAAETARLRAMLPLSDRGRYAPDTDREDHSYDNWKQREGR